MKKTVITKYFCCLGLMTLLASCNNWLSVDMEDSILEEKLYETNEGYLSVLNGVYAQLNENYGSTLSMGGIDVMAQYYNVAQNSNHEYYAYSQYKFDQLKPVSDQLWTKQYFLIANLNTLIERCDLSDAKIGKVYYPYVKGEALALRAFLHFDLFRLYGPIYQADTEAEKTLPYQATTSKDVQPLLSAKEFMAHVIDDLTAASELLANDRIRKEGVLNGEPEDFNEGTQLRYRQYRLNYYAVRALLARAYLWIGDRTNAYKVAKEVITEVEKEKVFPWTPKENVIETNGDKVFSTEVMFSLYNKSRVKLYDKLFNKAAGYNHCLTFMGKTMEEGNDESKTTFFFDDMGDVRRDNLWSMEEVGQVDENGTTVGKQMSICLNKFANNANESYSYMIPLIRISELYLIVAETTSDMAEALNDVNNLRAVRNCVKISEDKVTTHEALQELITKEFAREVIGEGQLYFYYKRLAMTSIQSGIDYGGWFADGKDDMVLSNYRWPVPDVENDKRITSKETK